MPVVTPLPTISDSQREALKYHQLLLAIEQRVGGSQADGGTRTSGS